MSKRKRAAEWIKTALIALLSVSAVMLAWQTGLFNEFFATVPFFGSVAELVRGGAGVAELGGTTFKEAARPLIIVVTNEEGGRSGFKYDVDERNAIYERVSSIFAEALGSASEPAEISESEWRSALSRAGVFIEYVAPVRLSVLDGWLGARMPETEPDVLLQRLFVAFGEDRSRLYLQDHSSGLFYGADTISAAGRAQELEVYGGNGAMFAFEAGVDAATNAPYMLIMPGSEHPDVRAAAAGSPEELLSAALEALGLLNESFTTYLDPENVFVCVGTQFRIRVHSDGLVEYRRFDGAPSGGEAQVLSEREMIERARAIIADSIGMMSGDAEVFFEHFEGADGIFTVFFGYYIAGGRVFLLEDRHGAWITFSDGVVTDAELNFRDFSFTGGHTRLLPERQALAAADGEFMLSYSDTGAETMHPSWVRVGG